MLRFVLSFFGAIASFAFLSLCLVAVGIGGIFYMYGKDLPSYETLAQYTPKTISRVYSGEGEIMDEFARERRLFSPSEEIPDLVKQAFISAEDKNFYTHAGYDPRGMASAVFDAVASGGEDVRGASTITQQVMKNFLLSSDQTAERKVKEIILATRMEQSLTKDHILELYLNEIFLGQNSYGVTSAAQTYFNKSLPELTPAEAAYLAVLPKAPSTYHPVHDRDRAIHRRNNLVLREMYENGYLDPQQYQEALDDPLRTVQGGDIESFRSSLPPRDYFTDEIRRQLSQEFGEEEFFTGGLSIRATVDPEMQLAAADALQRALERYDRGIGKWRGTGKTIEDLSNWQEELSDTRVPRDVKLESRWIPAVVLELTGDGARLGIEGWSDGDPEPFVPAKDLDWAGGMSKNLTVGDVVLVRWMVRDADGSFIRWTLRQVPAVQGAFMAMDVNTGRVLAMQGGFSYQASSFNRTTQAERQPGSSFKPFVYAAALDSGWTPATIVVDGPIEINTPQGVWRPKNYTNEYYGPTPVRTGIEQSRNLMTIRLAQEVGMDTIGRYAERFGVYDKMNRVLAASLGSDETTLFKMVAAYAMFANGGERVEPTLVDRVQDREGRTVYRHDTRVCENCSVFDLARGRAPRITSNRERVMDPITAYQLTSMMEGVVKRGTAARTVNLPVPIAGKTGTTNDAKDAWFVGFSSNISAGCYIGFDEPKSLGRRAGGGGLCGPVFNDFMQQAIKKYGGRKFRVPEGCRFIKIDRYTGSRLPDGASGKNVVSECFRDGEEPGDSIVIDGGWAASAEIPLVEAVRPQVKQVTSSTGQAVRVAPKANFNTLSSGGLY